jgi:hypothetical protein
MISRRHFLDLAASAAAVTFAPGLPALATRYAGTAPLKPNEYVWKPEAAPAGPLVIIVSLPEQLVHVYRNGVEIAVSTCSTGKPGHRTPTGVFTILEKQRKHVSSIYKGAQMPNMERLTWGGVALHAGNLPGYPASHGCIRLPLQFSALLFDVTHNGTVVIIADERTQPTSVVHPGVLLPVVAEAEARALGDAVGRKQAHGPWQATVSYPVASVVISRADRRAYVSRDGTVEAAYPVAFAEPGRPIGTHVYSLVGPVADGSGLAWLAFGVGKSPKDAHVVQWQGDAAMRRVVFSDPARARRIAESFHPGTTLLITDMAAPLNTRSVPKDFSIIASDHPV